MLWSSASIPANTYNPVTFKCNACGGDTKWSMHPKTRQRMLLKLAE